MLIILLLIGSALISGSEVAFFSLSSNELIELRRERSAASKLILKLRSIPRILLATILISNNFINIAIVILSDYILRGYLPIDICEQWAKNIYFFFEIETSETSFLANLLHTSITVVGVTFLLVLFGEVAPKVYAKINNIQLAKMMARPLLLLSKVFRPISNVLVGWTNVLEKNINGRTSNNNVSMKEDIDDAIELTVLNNRGAPEEVDILKSIIKFGDVSVKQIMRSRVDVVAIDFRLEFKELVQIIRESGFSRIPVYDNDFDNITGILYAKDLLGSLDKDEKFEWQILIRTDVFYVPETKKISDLLKDFQSRKQHMGIVVDEYGGCSGIVTLEDIMEEVIGDIKDEFDLEEEVEFVQESDYTYVFEGKTLLNDVCRIIGEDIDVFDEVKGDADSLAGLVLESIGHIPDSKSEPTSLELLGFKFEVLSVSERRIEKVRITLPQAKALT